MHVRSLFRATASAAFVALALPFASAQLFEVPTHYPTIQAAIDAAPSGASITVLPGQYAPFEIVGKSLSIHGAGAAHVRVGPGAFTEIGIVVRDLPLGGEVLLSGMTVAAQGDPQFLSWVHVPMIHVRDSAGTVLLSGFETSNGPESHHVSAALLVTDSALVIVDSSAIRATHGADPASLPAVAIRAEGSNVWISNSTVRGGNGKPEFCFGGAGEPGIEALLGSSVYVAASEVRGGGGGQGMSGFGCGIAGALGGEAAPAIRVIDSVTKVVRGDLIAGSPGLGSFCTGPSASAIVAAASQVLVADAVAALPSGSQCGFGGVTMSPPFAGDVFHHESRTYPTLAVSPAPAPPGATVAIHMEGDAGALAVLVVGVSAGPAIVLPPIDGATILAFSPLVLVQPFVLDGTGEAQVHVQLPANPAFAGASFPAQTIVFSGADGAFSNPVVIAGAP